MQKIIYKVEFDPYKGENLYTQIREIGKEYDVANRDERELGERIFRTVKSIEEKWERRSRTIVIHYEDEFEEEIFDIYHIYRKLILNDE